MNTLNENSVTDQTKNNKTILFPDYIIEEQTNFSYNNELYNICKKIESKGHKNYAQTSGSDEDSYSYQTIGGYQPDLGKAFTDLKSQEDGITLEEENIVSKLQSDIFNKYVNKYVPEQFPRFLEDKDLKLLYKCWFVKYNKNSFQDLHTHGSRLFTMVYFVKVPKVLNLIGKKPNTFEGSLVISNTKHDPFGLKTIKVTPEEGKIVIFPADYPHYVMPMFSDEDRVVIVEDIYLKQD